MYLNLFMDFPFVDLTNAKLRMDRLTEYLAPLKNSYLKKEKLLLRSVLFHYTVSVPYLHLTFISLYSLC